MNYHYLIDFENVHKDGFAGLEDIEDGAYIHIFYSENAKNISLSSFGNAKMLHLEVIKVPVGKQSLDMQLVSFLGYLIGKEKDSDNKYIIISKDNGYGNTPLFWTSLGVNERIEVRHQVSVEAPETPAPELFPTNNNRMRLHGVRLGNNRSTQAQNNDQRKQQPNQPAANVKNEESKPAQPVKNENASASNAPAKSAKPENPVKLVNLVNPADPDVFVRKDENSKPQSTAKPNSSANQPKPAEAVNNENQPKSANRSDNQNKRNRSDNRGRQPKPEQKPDSAKAENEKAPVNKTPAPAAALSVVKPYEIIKLSQKEQPKSEIKSEIKPENQTAPAEKEKPAPVVHDLLYAEIKPVVKAVSDEPVKTASAEPQDDKQAVIENVQNEKPVEVPAEKEPATAESAAEEPVKEEPVSAEPVKEEAAEAETVVTEVTEAEPAEVAHSEDETEKENAPESAEKTEEPVKSKPVDNSEPVKEEAEAEKAGQPQSEDEIAETIKTEDVESEPVNTEKSGEQSAESENSEAVKTESAPAVAESAEPGKSAEPAQKPAPKTRGRKRTKQPAQKNPQQVSEKTILNNQIMQTLAKEGIDPVISGSIASLILKNISEKNHKQFIYREIVKAHGQKDGLRYYGLIKSML